MRVSFEWIKDFVDIESPVEEVADRLTMAGLEIEGIETVGGDAILDVNVTPNRPDCLSILGIAREVAAAYGLPLKIPDTGISDAESGSDVTVQILDEKLCNRYAGRMIRGISIGDSPRWIQERLEKCGLRALNNNVVDITNYVLLEFGHPLHAFDADKLYGGKIRVAQAGKDRSITTLDGVERTLPEDALLIWDGKDPVAVAGIMGGEESSVTPDTRNIFLESAHFEPSSVRRTSKRIGLRSESSYRFERGADIEFLVRALDRAALLMKETGGGTIHEIVDEYPVKYEPSGVEFHCRRINSLLGTELEEDEIRSILSRVGVPTEEKGRDLLVAFPPAYRRDIREYVDVVEEVARIHGYGNIPVRVPKTPLSRGVLNSRERILGTVKEAVRKAGFSEVINYSFMNPSDLDMLSVPEEDERRRHVRVLNPLRQEDALMRTILVPSLIHNFVYNLSREIRDVRLFEMARVFIDEGGRLPTESLRLGGIFYRESLPEIWRETVPSFYAVKGALQGLFEEIKIEKTGYVPSGEAFLHSGKAADIVLDGQKIGFMGELHPLVVERLNLKVRKPEIVVFEIDVEALLPGIPCNLTYSQIPRYPSVERDVAIILDEKITAAETLGYFREYRSEFIERVELFDFYKGKNVQENMKSLAFRIIYRCNDRTLTDTEVEAVHQSLVDFILVKTGGLLRGA